MPNNYISSITLPNNDIYNLKDAEAVRIQGTIGDLLYWSSTDTPARRSIGTEGQVLKTESGVPIWDDEYQVELVDMMEAT